MSNFDTVFAYVRAAVSLLDFALRTHSVTVAHICFNTAGSAAENLSLAAVGGIAITCPWPHVRKLP